MENTSPPQILPVKEPPKEKPRKILHPNLPELPTIMCLVAPTKSGKCLYEYSLVETERGNIYIKNVKVGDKVLSDSGYVEVDKVFKQGKKKCFKIISDNGCELILTEDHKLHTLNGMKPMIECDNEMIITKTGMTKIKSKEYYGEVECYDISVKNDNHRFYANFFSVSNSTILSNLILRDDFFKDMFDNVTIMSNTIDQDVTSRFLRKACDCYTGYDDNVLAGIIEQQKSFDDDERPFVGMIFDDILGSVKRSSYLNHLVTRARHYGVGLLAISVQSFKAVGPTIRNNVNSFICCNLQNMSELDKISDEYNGMFGGDEKFRQIYAEATKNHRYDFMYLDLQSNPSRAFRNFEDLLAVGDQLMFGEGASLNVPEEGKTEVDLNEKIKI
jgi:hypothetical protein